MWYACEFIGDEIGGKPIMVKPECLKLGGGGAY